MRSNPYVGLPASARWDRSVSRGFNPADLYSGPTLIYAGEKIMSAGSCFAANIVPHIERHGLNYLRTEHFCSIFPPEFKENFAYDGLTARYGNIYTPRQLLQLLRRSLSLFTPSEDRWRDGNKVIDPFRPGLRYAALSDREFDVLTKAHLDAVLRAFTEMHVFIFTLGLTEAWENIVDGAVFPACPGTLAGEYSPDKHRFRNFNVSEIVEDFSIFAKELRNINPDVRLIITVSPVPLVATIEPRHVLQSTVYSKSVLRVAADTICRDVPNCVYFPAYEIVAGPQAPFDAYDDDRRNPSKDIIDTVMQSFFSHCDTPGEIVAAPPEINTYELSQKMAAADCEEAAVLKD